MIIKKRFQNSLIIDEISTKSMSKKAKILMALSFRE
jgi:hypothetical protein